MQLGVFIPEIHDVASAEGDELHAMMELLAPEARAVAPILVVPRWKGARSIAERPELVAELLALPGEKVLHGLTHSLGPSAWNHIVFGTEDESEFAGCTEREALDRLSTAQAIFTFAFGFAPRWFCAPRWHEGRETTLALRQLGIRGRMLRDGYVVGGALLPIEALWFDDGVRAVTRSLARRVRARRLKRILDERRPFRLALHPRDVKDARTLREIRTLLTCLEDEGWRPAGLPQMEAA